MMQKFRFAIIGPGKIARKWAEDLQNSVPEAEIVAVCGRTREKTEAFARDFGIQHVFDDCAEMLRSAEIDAAYIATPHPSHFEMAKHCLEHRVGVICEKPMCMRLSEVETLVALSVKQQTFLMEGIWTRFIPAFEKALDLVQIGAIGEVHTIVADFGFRASPDANPRVWQRALGAGSLLDIGIYPILFTQYLLGKPHEIKASATFTEQKIDDSCAMIFEWANHKQALLHSSIKTTTPTEAWVHGTLGSLHLHSRFHHTTALTLHVGDHITEIQMPYSGHGYYFEILAAMQYMRKGAIEHPLVSHQFSLDLAVTLGRVMDIVGLDY